MRYPTNLLTLEDIRGQQEEYPKETIRPAMYVRDLVSASIQYKSRRRCITLTYMRHSFLGWPLYSMKTSRSDLQGQAAHCVTTAQKLYPIEAFTVPGLDD